MSGKTVPHAGGIVIGDSGMIAMVRQSKESRWLFPKGHCDEGEDDEETARREVMEETGLTDLERIDDLGSYERYRINLDGSYDESELKSIHMFLFAAQPHATLAPTMEIEEAQWVSYREVASKIGDAKDRAWFASVFERVRQAIQRD